MRIPHSLLILSFALFCQVASATTHFIQVGQGGGNNFAPTFVIIVPGDTVQWDWVTGVHSVTSGTPGNPSGIFDSGISGPPNTFSFTFNTPGNYPFYCNVHGAMMTGTVYVAVVDPPTPTAVATATASPIATPTASPTSTPPASPTPTPPVTPTPSPNPCDWSNAAMFPIPISRTAMTSLNGNLYAFGGINNNGQYLPTSYKFDVIKSWTPIAPLPAALGGAMATNDGTFIYILGGANNFSTSPVNTMYRYDPSTNTYTTMAPFFTAVSDGAAAYLAGKIYKMMGETASASTNVLEIYTIATDTWTFGASPSPDGRAAFIGAFLQGNYIYVAGGYFPGSSPTNKTYRYDTLTNTWDDAAIADLPEPRYGAASAFHNGGGVLAGGNVGVGLIPPLSATTIRWDPITNTWSYLPDLPEERSLMGGAVLHGDFHIVGGGTLADPFGTTDHLKLPPCLPTPVPTPSPTPSGTPGPNGKIAFSSNRDGNFEIYVMDPDGSHVIRLTDNPEFDSSPVWSPDGTKIAFATSRDGNSEIYLMNPDGSGLTNLTHDLVDEVWPAWSPDGKKIAFTSMRTFAEGSWEIYVMNADGSNQTRVTNNPARDFGPAWSPDGTRIAFQSDRDDTKFDTQIYVVDVDGAHPLRLTNNEFGNAWPAWSPDGSKIAFSSQQGGVVGIFVMNPDGSDQTRLTGNPIFGEYPDWSPDGTKIVFSNGQILVMGANGANPISLTNSQGKDLDPSWQRRPTSTPVPSQALNISTRMRVETGANVLIGGFIITGSAPKTVAVRGIGPSLSQFGLGDLLADPTIQLRDAAGGLLQQNDNWQDDPEKASQLIALGLAPQDPNESGLVATLSPQSYTAIVAGKNAGTGVGLVEVYDINPSPDSQLANISTRGFVSTGSSVMIGGFILGGGNNTHVAVRGIGPSLAQFGLGPLLADPTVELRDGNGALLVSNDNWQDNVVSASHLTAFGLAPQDAAESAIYVGLPPGAFTAILAGKNGGTGIGVVDIFNLP